MSKNPKNRWESMKIANIDRECLHIFWTNWEISIKLSGKMWIMMILKVSLEDTFLGKLQGGGGGKIDPPVVLGLIIEN